ncbi:MAG: Crp/Fnr family transcriptional regulator [Myxococcota bacterium]
MAELCLSRDFEPKTWLLEAGTVAEWCYFLRSGLVRELYIDERGEEHTRTFLGEGQVTGSLIDLLSGAPAITWIEALEPTRTWAFQYRDFDRLTAQYPELGRLARRSAELLALRKTRREHEMLALSAEQRHQRWLDEHAAIDARINRRQLASYLGVTPEHLSRLRRRTAARAAPPPTRTRRRG